MEQKTSGISVLLCFADHFKKKTRKLLNYDQTNESRTANNSTLDLNRVPMVRAWIKKCLRKKHRTMGFTKTCDTAKTS